MRTHRTILTLLATAAATGASLVAVTGPADADVTAPDFPGVAEVAEVLPSYEGANRRIKVDHPIWIFRENCRSYEDGPSGEVRKWAYYETDGEQTSYPRVHVQEFAGVTAAKRAIRTIRSNIEGCYGVSRVPRIDGVFIRRPFDVPDLGDGVPVAWKINDHWTQGRDGLERAYYSRRIWMREGETVIGIDLWGEVPQSRAAAVALAELALETVD
jgi:hypothetical protein